MYSTLQPCRAQHCSLADCRSFCGRRGRGFSLVHQHTPQTAWPLQRQEQHTPPPCHHTALHSCRCIGAGAAASAPAKCGAAHQTSGNIVRRHVCFKSGGSRTRKLSLAGNAALLNSEAGLPQQGQLSGPEQQLTKTLEASSGCTGGATLAVALSPAYVCHTHVSQPCFMLDSLDALNMKHSLV